MYYSKLKSENGSYIDEVKQIPQIEHEKPKNKKSGNLKDFVIRSESQNEIEIDFGLDF